MAGSGTRSTGPVATPHERGVPPLWRGRRPRTGLVDSRDMESCVVTGAARGIGRGIAERMVARGYAVVVTDVDGEGARRTAEEIGAAVGLEQDVRDAAGHRFVATTAQDLGRLTAWFNNAGVGD